MHKTRRRIWRVWLGDMVLLPCRLREYSVRNVSKCVTARYNHGKQTRIAFIGDSKGSRINVDDLFGTKATAGWTKYKSRLNATFEAVPNLVMEFFWAPVIYRSDRSDNTNPITDKHIGVAKYFLKQTINYLKEMKENLKMVKLEGINSTTFSPINIRSNNLTAKIPSDGSPVSGKKLNTILLNGTTLNETKLNGMTETQARKALKDFYDSDVLHPGGYNGALDEMKRWLMGRKQDLPDLVVLGSGPWHLMDEVRLKVLDSNVIAGFQSAFKTFQELAQKTKVVIVLAEPIKDYIFHDSGRKMKYTAQTNSFMEWVMNGEGSLLPEGVVVWDTFLPVALASLQDCITLNSHHKEQEPPEREHIISGRSWWHCSDRMHLGYEVLEVAMQMLMNELCNGFVGDGNACCDPVA